MERKPVTDKSAHILVVDDDRRIRDLIKTFLNEHGFRVSAASDASRARKQLEGLEFDLLILDVMMPGESGIELASSLREHSDVPILILSALAEPENRIEGLRSGIDDYLVKPFDPEELVLRINAILRRAHVPKPDVLEIRMGENVFYVERGELRRGDQTIRLTSREQDLLRMFAGRAGETISRADLSQNGADESARAVDVQINRLRRKIEPDPAAPTYLQTVRGAGYILYTD